MAEFRINTAEIADMKQMYLLIRKMLMESPEYSATNVNDTKVVANLERYIVDEDRCAFVAKSGGFIVGLFLGYTYIPEMTDELTAADTILFVEKPYRNDGVGQRLLEAYTEWAKKEDAGTIYFGTTTGLTPEATQKVIKNTNFKTVGQVARYR